jgi:hypothetical protein
VLILKDINWGSMSVVFLWFFFLTKGIYEYRERHQLHTVSATMWYPNSSTDAHFYKKKFDAHNVKKLHKRKVSLQWSIPCSSRPNTNQDNSRNLSTQKWRLQ